MYYPSTLSLLTQTSSAARLSPYREPAGTRLQSVDPGSLTPEPTLPADNVGMLCAVPENTTYAVVSRCAAPVRSRGAVATYCLTRCSTRLWSADTDSPIRRGKSAPATGIVCSMKKMVGPTGINWNRFIGIMAVSVLCWSNLIPKQKFGRTVDSSGCEPEESIHDAISYVVQRTPPKIYSVRMDGWPVSAASAGLASLGRQSRLATMPLGGASGPGSTTVRRLRS
jgi:hypothetical protein